MSNQEKIVRLLTIIAKCQISSIWDKQPTRAGILLQELFDLDCGGGEE